MNINHFNNTSNVSELHNSCDGKIIILNGAPRSGKSSIAAVIQNTFDGIWLNMGVDHYMKMIPEKFQPGIGLRPGGERPDLEPMIFTLYPALYESITAHSRRGINIVADFGHHDFYSAPSDVMRQCAEIIADCPSIFVGVRCPLDVIMNRRMQTWGKGYNADGSVPEPIMRWQNAVHEGKIYDLEVDTSLHSPEECAEIIRQRMMSGEPMSAFKSMAK